MDETPVATRRGDERRRSRLGLLAVTVVGGLIVAAVVGFALTRPTAWERSGAPIKVSAWVPYWQSDSGFSSFSANAAVFSDVSMFAYHATAAHVISAYQGVDTTAQARFRAVAAAGGTAVTASIIDDTEPGTMALILSDPTSRAVHVQTIAAFAADNDFDGIDIDYENFAFNDGRDTWESTRPNWVAFITELADVLHRDHRTLTVSAPYVLDGKHTADSGYWVYDYAAIDAVVDHIRIMAYDYSTSEPGPIAPLPWVRSVVKAAKSLVPSRKLVLGIPVYGRDWAGDIVGTCPADQQPSTHSVSNTTAAELAASKGVAPTWAETSAERTFSYTEQLVGLDANGVATTCTVTRTVWYPDDRSVYERAWIAERQDLSGIALFPLGTDAPTMWPAIALARANTDSWPVDPMAAVESSAPTTTTTVVPAVVVTP